MWAQDKAERKVLAASVRGGLVAIGLTIPQLALASVIEEIVVTAQKREQYIQEIPVAVSALSGGQLTELSITDVFDLQQSVPALAVTQNQSATTTVFSIRGVGTSGSNFGLESSVGLYVDGVYRPRQNSMINELVDIEQVEVLRGPQGTLFGRNTSSGAVLMSTVAPSHEFGGYIEAGVGNLNLVSVNGAVGGSVVEDVLAWRLTGFGTSRDGFVDDVHLGDNKLNDRDREGGRLQFLYTPNDDLSLRLIADYSQIDEVCCAAVTVRNNYQVFSRNSVTGAYSATPGPGTDSIFSIPRSVLIPGLPVPVAGFGATIVDESRVFDDVVAFSQLPLSSNEDQGLSAELNWSVLGGELTAISGWRRFDSSDDVDGDFSTLDFVSRREDARQDSFSQEIRFHINDDNYDFLLGAYYFQQDLDTTSQITLGSDANNSIALSVFSEAGNLANLAAAAAQGGDLATAAALGGLAQQLGLTASAMVVGLENVPLPPGHPLFGLQALGVQGVAFPDNQRAVNQMEQEHKNWAIYGQYDYRFSPRWLGTLGLRYTNEDKQIAGRFTQPGASWGALLGLADLTLANPRSNVAESLEDEQVTGTVKLSWFPSDDMLFFASWATGYKAGGTNTDRISPAFSVVFDAETSQTFELGMKADFPRQNLRVNLSLHHTVTEDYQTNSFQGAGFNLANAGEVKARGGELELWWQPTDELSLNGAYVYNKAEFVGFDRANCWIAYSWLTGIQDPGRGSPQDGFCDRSGDPLDTNAEHTFIIGATRVFTIDHQTEAYVRADYNYSTEQYMDGNIDPLKKQDGYGIANLRTGLRFLGQQLEIALWARNILDEDYSYVHFDVPLQSGKLAAYPAEPRTYGLGITKTF